MQCECSLPERSAAATRYPAPTESSSQKALGPSYAKSAGTSARTSGSRRRRRPDGGLRQPGLGEAVGDALKIARLLVGKNTRALRQREVRVDLEKIRPGRARLVEAPEMAVAGRQQHAARIGGGEAPDALGQQPRGGVEFSQAEIRLRQDVQHDRGIVWIKPHRGRDRLERLG